MTRDNFVVARATLYGFVHPWRWHVANRRLSMRKIREVLRLAFGAGTGAAQDRAQPWDIPRDGVELRCPGAGGRPVVAVARVSGRRDAGPAAVPPAGAFGRRPPVAGLGVHPQGASPQERHEDAVVGRVQAGQPGWLPALPVLRTVRRVGGQDRPGDAAGSPGRFVRNHWSSSPEYAPWTLREVQAPASPFSSLLGTPFRQEFKR